MPIQAVATIIYKIEVSKYIDLAQIPCGNFKEMSFPK